MKVFKSILLQLFECCCHILPVSSNKVYFQSFAGQYNDNPKAISVKIHEVLPDLSIYWSISSKSKRNDIPDYVNTVEYGSFRSIIIKNRCRVIVENGAGFYLVNTHSKAVLRIKRRLKNHKQFDLSTWHGNPIKHIGAQIPGTITWTKDNSFSTSDLLLAGCEQVKKVFEQAFINLMPVTLTGTPRTDILFELSENKRNELRVKLGLPTEKKIILYAPTYRNSPIDSGITQLQMMNLNKLFDALHGKFGGEWVFVMRVHNMVLMEINNSSLVSFSDLLYNGNQFDDMNEYLYVCDVLLTDYSGCIYDVALTEKPCFLFAHDRKNYEERERGVYTSLSLFPYSFSESFDELLSNISDYSFENTDVKRRRFLDEIGNVEDGHSASRAVAIIMSHLV